MATRVFVAADSEPSMRAIAREAEVGIGTLYRHFPHRESLVDAVYRDQVTRLTDGARELLAELSPPAALRRWMDLFGDWIATKNGMLDTLLAMIESGELPHAETQAVLHIAIDDILKAGRATGELRTDVTAEDIAASLIGIFTVAHPPEHAARASRLLNILKDGLRPAPGTVRKRCNGVWLDTPSVSAGGEELDMSDTIDPMITDEQDAKADGQATAGGDVPGPRLDRAGQAQFVPFLEFDPEIRKIICTTDAIESLNSRYRRAVNAREHFPTEQAALKCLYLVTRSLDPTGRGRARWVIRRKAALNAFDVAFEGRLTPSTTN